MAAYINVTRVRLLTLPACGSICFSTLGRQAGVADFVGGQISADGGAWLLREAAGIGEPRVGGGADRAAIFKRLAAACGIQTGGCVPPPTA